MPKKLLFLDGFEINTEGVTDGESSIQYAVSRGLKLEDSEIKIIVISNMFYEWAECSKYVDEYYCLKNKVNVKQYLDEVLNIIKKQEIDLIFPVSVPGVDFVLKHKEELNRVCNISLLPAQNTFEMCVDKWNMYQTLLKYNVPLPHTELHTSFKNYDSSYYPRLFKPKSGKSGKGIFILKEKPLDSSVYINNMQGEQYLTQEYIKGYDMGCNVLCKDGNIVQYSIQKAHAGHESFLSTVAKLEFIHNQDLLDIVVNIMKNLKYTGVANLDFRYDQVNNRFVLIEINPRYWGSLKASLSIGVNFPYAHYLLSNGSEVKSQKYNSSYYVNLITLLKDIIKFKFNYNLSKYNLNYLLMDRCNYWIKLKKLLKNSGK